MWKYVLDDRILPSTTWNFQHDVDLKQQKS